MNCPKCAAQIPDDAKSCVMCGTVIGSGVPQGVPAVEIDTKKRAATQWLRLVNYFIDGIGCGIVGSVLNSLFFSRSVVNGNASESIATVFATVLYVILYYVFFESIWQRTPGKWASGTKVVALDGSKPSVGAIIGRSFARYIPFEQFSFLFGKHPHGWHDSLSKTIVVPVTYTPEDVRSIDIKDKGRGSVLLVVLAVLSIVIPLVLIAVALMMVI